MTRELADVADAIVGQVAHDQWRRRAERFGTPGRGDGRRSRWAIVGLGKLGGRELNYHSDLDLVFLHESDGETRGGAESISNDQFVSEVVRRVLKALAGSSSGGSLYAVDTRLRPHGASGPLVVTLDAFRDYFRGPAQAWERLALTRARVLFANGGFGRVVTEAIHDVLASPVDPRAAGPRGRRDATQARRLARPQRPETRRRRPGRYRVPRPVPPARPRRRNSPRSSARTSGMRSTPCDEQGCSTRSAHAELREAYNFFRTVEARLRIVHNRSGADLPDDPDELARLARRLNYDETHPDAPVDAFRADAVRHAARTRTLFQEIVCDAAGETVATLAPS